MKFSSKNQFSNRIFPKSFCRSVFSVKFSIMRKRFSYSVPKVNYIIGNAQRLFTTTFPDGHSTWTIGTQLLVDLLRFLNILIHQTIPVRKPNHRAVNSIDAVVCYCKHLARFTIQFAKQFII